MDRQTGERVKDKLIPVNHREIVHATIDSIEATMGKDMQGQYTIPQWKIGATFQGEPSIKKPDGSSYKWSTYVQTLGKSKKNWGYPAQNECPEIFKEYAQEPHKHLPAPVTLYVGRGDKKDKNESIPDEQLQNAWDYHWYLLPPYFDREGKAVQESRPPVETVAEQETMSALHSTSEVEEEPQEIDELDKMKNRINEQQMFIMRQSSTGYGASILSDAERNIPCVDCKIELLSRYANSILDSILLGQTPPYIKNHQHPDQETDEEIQGLLDQAEEDMENNNG